MPPVAVRRPSDPGSAGIVLDFDGTLSPIAPTPGEARPLPEAPALLAALASAYRVVAVVSGRRAREVRDLLGAGERVRVLGLYGLEGEGADRRRGPVPEAVMEEVRRAAALVPGASVEPKGPQVAVHYRAARDHEAARRVLLARLGEVAERHGFRLLEGKRVVELAVPGGGDKGAVVERLAREEGLREVLYAGDDEADLAAFEALARLGREGVVTTAVAVRSAETPPELLAAADVVVDGPGGLLGLLRGLLPDPG